MAKPIRKVSVSTQMKEELREYAWRNRTSMSAVVTDICNNLGTNPRYYQAWAQGDENKGQEDSLTLYVNEESWLKAKDVLYFARTPLTVGIRQGLRAVLSSEGIPE